MNEDRERELRISRAVDSYDYAIAVLPNARILEDWERIRKKAEEDGLFPSQEEVKIGRRAGIDNEEKRKYVEDEAGQAGAGELSKILDETIKRSYELLGIKEAKPLGTVGRYNQDSKTWEDGMSESELEPHVEGATVGTYNQDAKKYEGGIEAKKDDQEPLGTVGSFNQDTGKYEGGLEVKDDQEPKGTVGSFNQDSKQFEDGINVKDEAEQPKGTVGAYNQDTRKWEGGVEEDQPGYLKTVDTVKAKGIPLPVKAGECKIEDCVTCLRENTCPR